MVRSNIIKFMNIATFCYYDNNQYIFPLNTNNGKIILTTPGKKYFDNLNFCESFFKKNNKRLSLSFFKKYFSTQWTRVVFRGKSYRVKCFKSIKKFTFNFGYSHWSKFKGNDYWSIFRKRRQNYLIFTYNSLSMQFFKRLLPRVRVYNPYTMRGLRLKKQAIIRRFGKISQHVSILH